MKLDLNCDLGEGEPASRTRALMARISSANIACGGHAGDVLSMTRCVRLAMEFRVHIGAHPGAWDRGDFGRGAVSLTPSELELLLVHQVSALDRIARTEGGQLHHIKLHGALYHLTDNNRELGMRYLKSIARWWPDAILFVRAGGRLQRLARKAGLNVWGEAFADREYDDDGSLLPRNLPGAVLADSRKIAERVRALAATGILLRPGRTPLALRPETLCFHSDTPGAVPLARKLAQILGAGAGSKTAPFCHR